MHNNTQHVQPEPTDQVVPHAWISKILFSEQTLLEISRTDIENLLKRTSPWSIKEAGKSYVPKGDATQAYERLSGAMRDAGHVLDVGELENFVPSVGNHGPQWVNEALKKDLISDPELESARRFLAQLCNVPSS